MDLKKKSQTMDMTKGSPTSLLLRFAMPLFLGNLLQQFYNLVDTSIAGNLLGDGALAQIGATAALYSLITNFAFGMNNGLALGVSRNFGAGDQQGVKKSVCWMTCLSCFCSVVLTVAFLIFRKGLLQVMQIPDDVMDGALRYLTIILAGIPLTMLYNLEASLLQAVGNSVMPLVFLLFSSVLNVGLDFWFMGPLGLGVQGAASATVLAQGISAGIGLGYIVRYYPELRFSKNEFKVKKNLLLFCNRDVFLRFKYGDDECYLLYWQCDPSEQYQCTWKCLYCGAGWRQEACGTVLYSRTGTWNQHGDLCQPELWGGPGKKNPQRLSDSNSSVWDLVDHCTYVYFYPGTGSNPASYRKQQPGGDL